MNANLGNVKAVFLEAIEKHSPDQWGQFLDTACNGDQEMRQHVELLLQAHESGESLLDKGAIKCDATSDSPSLEKLGTKIGPYKLLQELGEGGMGVVYMAEQKTPVRRRVAVKIIKPGLDSREVLARFEAERQALALMDHPNIAKVLDAGATENASPYFVMELVKGIPINEYCSEHNLSLKQRLELFIPVCRALQHAHQKGVVHRDIKPTNVLVAEHDNQPVPIVIDFGVAKAVDQPLTERTMFTQFGQIVGTPEYMSPEQAKLNQLDVDTRSDIYSLGVLMYELLTGMTPFDKQRLRSVAFDELLRIIREEEPPRPSVRLSTVDSKLEKMPRKEPKDLSLLLRGELDWIVMKALSKERSDRYDSASMLADDVGRHLDGEPVQACPPSTVYQLRKFAARYRKAILTVSLLAFVMSLGLVSTSVMAVVAKRQAELAEQKAAEAEQSEKIAQDRLCDLRERVIELAFQAVFAGEPRADKAIEDAEKVGAHPAIVKALKSLLNLNQGNIQEAFRLASEAIEESPGDHATWCAAYYVCTMSFHLQMRGYLKSRMEEHGIAPDYCGKNDYERFLSIQAHRGSLEQVNDLISKHPTWIAARLNRAVMVTSSLASREQPLENELEQAIRDVSLAREVFPDSPNVAFVDWFVHSRVIHRLHEADADRDLTEFEEAIAPVAERLRRYPYFVAARWGLMKYYESIGDSTRAERQREAALELGLGGLYVLGVRQYQKGNAREAVAILDREPYPLAQIWKAYAQSDIDRNLALRTYHDFAARDDLHVNERMHAVTILMLLGETKKVVESELRKISPLNEFGGLHSFWLGDMDEDEYTSGLPSDWKGLVGHYDMGVKAMWQDRREEAIRHFKNATDPSKFVVFLPHCHWAQAFLERLENDPGWPAKIRQQGP